MKKVTVLTIGSNKGASLNDCRLYHKAHPDEEFIISRVQIPDDVVLDMMIWEWDPTGIETLVRRQLPAYDEVFFALHLDNLGDELAAY